MLAHVLILFHLDMEQKPDFYFLYIFIHFGSL